MAQKEYLKMADVFPFGTIIDTDPHYNGWAVIQAKDKNGNTATIDESGDGGFYEKTAKYISHAINSHDELVAEVERLRGALSASMSVLYEVERVTSELIKNGCYVVDDINAEVSYSIKLVEAIEE